MGWYLPYFGSNADGANPSEAALGIWACNVPVREHQASGSRCGPGPTVTRAVSPSFFGDKPQEAGLTSPEGAGGSKPLPRFLQLVFFAFILAS